MSFLKTRTAYVIGVVIVLTVLLCVMWAIGGETRFKAFSLFALGFLAGMLSMWVRLRIVEPQWR